MQSTAFTVCKFYKTQTSTYCACKMIFKLAQECDSLWGENAGRAQEEMVKRDFIFNVIYISKVNTESRYAKRNIDRIILEGGNMILVMLLFTL